MLDKKDKQVMKFLCEMCPMKRAYLIPASSIAEFVSKKYLITLFELDEIMLSLSRENYLEFVVSESKKGYYYCVTLKTKGHTFKKDQQKEKKAIVMLLMRTLGLAVLSFVIGLLLKVIFKG